MRAVLAVVALVVGGYLIADGIKVLVDGRFFGPDVPGPWRHVVGAAGIDPFDMGPVFLVLGAAWLAATGWLLVSGSALAWVAALVVAVLTLWWLPFGTLLSLVALALLIAGRSRFVV